MLAVSTIALILYSISNVKWESHPHNYETGKPYDHTDQARSTAVNRPTESSIYDRLSNHRKKEILKKQNVNMAEAQSDIIPLDQTLEK